jgi:hypothetical protein
MRFIDLGVSGLELLLFDNSSCFINCSLSVLNF